MCTKYEQGIKTLGVENAYFNINKINDHIREQ